MMRRHLLTLFALFSGIAALHAPAHASALQSVVSDARAFTRAIDAAASENCNCPEQAERRSSPCPSREKRALPARMPDGLRPPFVFGAERALE